MQAKTFRDLLEWTSMFHNNLAQHLEQGLSTQQEERARWLMGYLADHERVLAETVDRCKKQADDKALNTWLYEHLTETLPPSDGRYLRFGEMSFDEISAEIFDVHNQVIETYKTMSANAAIPEAKELMAELLELEEHEALRLANQINSSRGM